MLTLLAPRDEELGGNRLELLVLYDRVHHYRSFSSPTSMRPSTILNRPFDLVKRLRMHWYGRVGGHSPTCDLASL